MSVAHYDYKSNITIIHKDFFRCHQYSSQTLRFGSWNVIFFLRRLREISKSNRYLRHVRPSFRIEQLGSHWTDFDEIWYLSFFFLFENLWGKLQFHWNLSLHEDTSWKYLAELSLEWKVLQIKAAEKIKTHVLYSATFFRKSCRLRENVENVVQPERPQTNCCMGVACWISKARRAKARARTCAPTPIHADACPQPRALARALRNM
jgi:hypothetical protein